MYFHKENSFYHGIMFHHFHDDEIHTKSQGSLSKDDFYKMINFIGRDNILDAKEFYEKLKNNKLKNNEVCLTFDDAIKSQIDVALPVLEELKIKSFFFVNTSIFQGKPDNLKFFRYFRINYFNNIDEFYDSFYQVLDKDLKSFFEKNSDLIKEYKIKYPYFSISDIKYRLVRDYFLTKSEHEEKMFLLLKEKQFNYNDCSKKTFFQKDDLDTLDSLGHLVGLHSHTHPASLERLNYDEQKDEYEKCLSSISDILNKPKNEINYMSHPCDKYNEYTLQILKELGIDLGFKQVMNIEPEKGMKKVNNSLLEIAREDHSNIYKRMNG